MMQLHAIYNAANNTYRVMGGEWDGDWVDVTDLSSCLSPDKQALDDIIACWPEMKLQRFDFLLLSLAPELDHDVVEDADRYILVYGNSYGMHSAGRLFSSAEDALDHLNNNVLRTLIMSHAKLFRTRDGQQVASFRCVQVKRTWEYEWQRSN